ncbi:unnamed protein product [Eruca vesicaria subsp. sativa]|uniref:K-box domain-containing protein n=1 Tax=Eruca vesicaria subsp. sativa TaxID=29727 RepID=A0ABC8K0Z7_ERUVS|nr:unnamed protein product [Eruca vesicaria subsp. sativa]
MLKTLERYQKCNYGPPEPNVPSREALAVELSSQQEYLRLKERYDALQRTQRNLLGEDLGPLSTKELESLERQLDSSLKQIRALRTQFMLDQLNDLQSKERMLTDTNKTLRLRLADGYQMPFQLNPNQEEVDVDYGRHQQQQQQAFFQPLEYEPIFQIGYHQGQQQDHAMEAGPSASNYMLGWLPYDTNSI